MRLTLCTPSRLKLTSRIIIRRQSSSNNDSYPSSFDDMKNSSDKTIKSSKTLGRKPFPKYSSVFPSSGQLDSNHRVTRPLSQIFSDLPNYLQDPESVLHPVLLSRNKISLTNKKEYPYGYEDGSVKEWQGLAESVLARKGAQSVTRKTSISPALLLSYSSHHGKVLMEKTAVGLAKHLNADFIQIDKSQINLILDWLKGQYRKVYSYRRRGEIEGVSRYRQTGNYTKSLSEVLAGEVLYDGKISLMNARPISCVLDYIEFCMSQLPEASNNRVIYLSCSKGNSIFDLPQGTSQIETFLRERRLTTSADDSTLFIFSEGSPNNPQLVKGREFQTAFSISSSDVSAEDTEFMDSEVKRPSATITLKGNTAVSRNNNHFEWLFDDNLSCPRLLLYPPTGEGSSLHKAQLSEDRSKSNFIANLTLLKSKLKDLDNNRPAASIHSNFPPLETLLSLRPNLCVFKHKLLSQAEVTTLALLMANSYDPKECFKEFLIKSVDDFTKNRINQIEGADNLKFNGTEYQKNASENDTSDLLNLEDLPRHEKRLISCIVRPTQVKTTFDEIGALDNVKRSLYELITLRLERPDYFTKGVLKDSVSGILLFGPPGTGKTMLARAVAAQSGANFIAVNSSSIFDMYVGEGEKNVKALFSLARKISPCIIFVDEVDALLDARDHSVGRTSRVEIINEFMSEWDGLLSSQSNKSVTVLAATNRPFALDEAVLRRLPRRILVDLPDASARHTILNLLLKDDILSSNVDLQSLAIKCDHYSGSDLKNLCMAAAMRALRRHRQNSQKEMMIEMVDFIDALQDVPSSISEQMGIVHDLREWDRRYGEGKQGGSGKANFGFDTN